MDTLDNLIPAFIERLCENSNKQSGLSGLPSGFKELDRLTGGFDESDLIVIGSRPLMGKTMFMINLIRHMAIEYNIPSLFFSLDMSDSHFISRMLSAICEIDNMKFRNAMLSKADWVVINNKIASLNQSPLWIYDKTLTVEELCDRTREMVAQHDIKVVFIDYLQLLSPSVPHENRNQDVAYCMRKLKCLSKELRIPIIVTSQVNRNAEYRIEKNPVSFKPEMHNLRDSGTICEDANIVLLLDRPELSQRNTYEDDSYDIKNVLLVSVAKNNNGQEDVLKMRFRGDINRIDDWSSSEQSDSLPALGDIDSLSKCHTGYSNFDSAKSPF